MNEWLKNYVLSLTGVSIISLCVDCFLQNGKIKKYARFAIALVLSLCIIQPILSIGSIELPQIDDGTRQNVDYSYAIEATVRGVSGFENAVVSVEELDDSVSKIYIYPNNDKLFEDAKALANVDFLKNVISAMFSIKEENIIIKR